MKYYIKYVSPVADLYLVEEQGQLVEIAFHHLEKKEEMEEKIQNCFRKSKDNWKNIFQEDYKILICL